MVEIFFIYIAYNCLVCVEILFCFYNTECSTEVDSICNANYNEHHSFNRTIQIFVYLVGIYTCFIHKPAILLENVCLLQCNHRNSKVFTKCLLLPSPHALNFCIGYPLHPIPPASDTPCNRYPLRCCCCGCTYAKTVRFVTKLRDQPMHQRKMLTHILTRTPWKYKKLARGPPYCQIGYHSFNRQKRWNQRELE